MTYYAVHKTFLQWAEKVYTSPYTKWTPMVKNQTHPAYFKEQNKSWKCWSDGVATKFDSNRLSE